MTVPRRPPGWTSQRCPTSHPSTDSGPGVGRWKQLLSRLLSLVSYCRGTVWEGEVGGWVGGLGRGERGGWNELL